MLSVSANQDEKKLYESKNLHHLKIYHDLKTLTRQA